MEKIYAKPKECALLRYGFDMRCYIHLYPQQKWIVHAMNENYVNLENKGKKVEIQLKPEDFIRLFIWHEEYKFGTVEKSICEKDIVK
jgi:hypothetical protein